MQAHVPAGPHRPVQQLAPVHWLPSASQPVPHTLPMQPPEQHSPAASQCAPSGRQVTHSWAWQTLLQQSKLRLQASPLSAQLELLFEL